MYDQYVWLLDRIAADRKLVTEGIARMHEYTGRDTKLAFAMGTGAGQLLNKIETFEQLTELHRPEVVAPAASGERVEAWCIECSKPDNLCVPWPCASIKAVASAYRYDNHYHAMWGS